jgi:hypothetical protein
MCDSKFSLIEDGAVHPLAPISSREVIACNSHRENFVPVDAFEDLRACLSCFRNRNKKGDSEGLLRGLQKTWIVKIILAQFSLIRGALLTRLQKLKTRFLQRTWKSDTSVFASFLGVSILFCNASSAQKNRLYCVRSTSNGPINPSHKTKRPNAQRVTKC